MKESSFCESSNYNINGGEEKEQNNVPLVVLLYHLYFHLFLFNTYYHSTKKCQSKAPWTNFG